MADIFKLNKNNEYRNDKDIFRNNVTYLRNLVSEVINGYFTSGNVGGIVGINANADYSYCVVNVEKGVSYSINTSFENPFSFFTDDNNIVVSLLADVKTGNYIYSTPVNATKLYLCTQNSIFNDLVVLRCEYSIIGFNTTNYPIGSKINTFNTIKNLNSEIYNCKIDDLLRGKIYIGANTPYPRLTDGLAAAYALGECDVYIGAGVYDVYAELGDLMLTTYAQGIPLGKGMRLFFSSGSSVTCYFPANGNEQVHQNFSVFSADCTNYEIYNMNVYCNNVRYCVHDECGGQGEYTHKYINCNMYINNTNTTNWGISQCIGGGLGQFATILVDGGIYESVGMDTTTEKGTITYHQPMPGTTNNFINNITIRNVYFKTGTCFVSCLGDNTVAGTMFYCNNCSMKLEPYVNGLDNPLVNHNVVGVFWNNEVRSA